VSNLDKVLYPATGTTKAEVLRYYVDVAEVMLPHLAGHRPVTLKRFPDGVEGRASSRSAARRTAGLARPRSSSGRGRAGTRDEGHRALRPGRRGVAGVGGEPGALELHVPMGAAPDTTVPTAVVFDLDPGAPADVRHLRRGGAAAARGVRRLADVVGEDVRGKGLQVYVPVNDPGSPTTTRAGSRSRRAAARDGSTPELVVSPRLKTERPARC
jgi:bifunctional non-homologous end joining protein LigD